VSIVVGTAGHIDHGKTTLLRALTGIDADRLPEERRRGMTIDVGYAHLTLEGGRVIDFVDVPGHDKLVGNMLVGAGEIDAAMLVVAADDGPRAQTLEHLALLDALGITAGVAVVTKIDAVAPERAEQVRTEVEHLLARTSLAGAPVVLASGTTGDGVEAVGRALAALVEGAAIRRPRPASLAIDRVFSVKGRGVVVTGSLRGGPLAVGDRLRRVPGDEPVRVREIQVRGRPVEHVTDGGRTALNLAGLELDQLHRGDVLTVDAAVLATDRLLVVLHQALPERSRARLHLGTAAVDAAVGRSGQDVIDLADGAASAILRLALTVAVRPGDRFVLRRGSKAPVGGVVLDARPPRGVSRRRQTPERVEALRIAVIADDAAAGAAARLDLHGAAQSGSGGEVRLAAEVAIEARAAALAAVPDAPALAGVRASVAQVIRRRVTVRRDLASLAAADVIDQLVLEGALVRDGDRLRLAGTAAPAADPAMEAAMDRLVASLAVPAPPPLGDAARAAGCPPTGVRELERTGRIVILAPDLAYAMTTYRDLTARALAMATRAPLTPAAYRDATGTSRKFVMAILEDLDRRAILRRTPDGHVPGPKAPAAVRAAGPR
jgi:selenocysteine-specific elongation factor